MVWGMRHELLEEDFVAGLRICLNGQLKADLLFFYRLAPYERRVIELLRNSQDKRARKLAKKRVCSQFFHFAPRPSIYQAPKFPYQWKLARKPQLDSC